MRRFSTDIAILGAGAAGMAAAEAVVEAAAEAGGPGTSVTLITAEPGLPYKRTKVSKSLASGFGAGAFSLQAPDWFDRSGIRLLSETQVTAIAPGARELRAQNADGPVQVGYSALILATGSGPGPLAPDDPLSAIPAGCIHYGHSRAAVLQLREAVRSLSEDQGRAARVAVIGGGVLGVELACELQQIGAAISLLHRGDRLMDRNLDVEASDLLAAASVSAGVRVLTGVTLKTAKFAHGQITLTLSPVAGVEDRDNPGPVALPGIDLLVRACGHRPEITVTLDAGIACRTGILVDHRLQTDATAVFAAGDCAEHPSGRVTHLWRHALEQGRIAGRNALRLVRSQSGSWEHYSFVPFRLKCNVFGHYLFSLLPEPGDTEEHPERVQAGDRCYRLFWNGGKLCGLLMSDDRERADLCLQAVRERWPRDQVFRELQLDS